MDEQENVSQELADLLLEHREDLANAWGELFEQAYPAFRPDYPRAAAYEMQIVLLDTFGEILTAGGLSESAKQSIRAMHHDPLVLLSPSHLALSIDSVLMFFEATLPVIQRACAGELIRTDAMLLRLNKMLRTYSAYSHSLLADDMSRMLVQEREKTAILEERQRLSREIHDNLSQALDLLKLQSGLASQFQAAGQAERLEAVLQEMNEIADNASADAREAILNLRCIERGEMDLVASLNRCLDRFRASFGVDARLEVKEEVAIGQEPQASLQVLRIVQEALSNVRKHACAQTVRVRVGPVDDWVCIVVEDMGPGFDLAAVGHLGVGLEVMRERAQSIGGRVEIDSEPGHGTRVTVWVPRAHKGHEGEEHGTAAHPVGR